MNYLRERAPYDDELDAFRRRYLIARRVRDMTSPRVGSGRVITGAFGRTLSATGAMPGTDHSQARAA